MAVPSNTVQTFAMVGIREQLSDVISMLSPMDVPFYSMCRKGTADMRTPEWMIDTLAAPDPTNATIEGDDVTNDAGSQPVRQKNVVQLFDKGIQVSSTAQAVKSAGRSNELKYQTLKKGKELKRDMEARFSGNYPSVLGAAGTAGQSAGAEAFITTNVDRGATGANGGYNSGTGLIAVATDGTLRTATETLLKSVIAKAWTAGGEPDTIMVGGLMKQKFSGFTGIATQYRQSNNNSNARASILGAADVYISDFGEHRIVPSRFNCYSTARGARTDANSNRTALVLSSNWSVNFLQPIKTIDLGKTGHSDRKAIYCECTLECADEAANGVLADIQTT